MRLAGHELSQLDRMDKLTAILTANVSQAPNLRWSFLGAATRMANQWQSRGQPAGIWRKKVYVAVKNGNRALIVCLKVIEIDNRDGSEALKLSQAGVR